MRYTLCDPALCDPVLIMAELVLGQVMREIERDGVSPAALAELERVGEAIRFLGACAARTDQRERTQKLAEKLRDARAHGDVVRAA